jgi:hypothetical protein
MWDRAFMLIQNGARQSGSPGRRGAPEARRPGW